MTYLEFENMRYSFRVETTFSWQECTQSFEAYCKPFCLVTRRGFAAKIKARRLPLEQVFKRKRRSLLNGNEKSTLLEEKKRESIAIYRTTLRPSQWRLRLIVTRHKLLSRLAGRLTISSRGVTFVRPSLCSLPLFHLVIILKWILTIRHLASCIYKTGVSLLSRERFLHI